MAEYGELELGLYYQDVDSYVLELRFRDPDDPADPSPYRGPVRFDFDALRQARRDPEAYGQHLTDRLFGAPDARTEFEKACVRTLEKDKMLRLRLYIDRNVPELHHLHWETLRDPRNGAALLTNQRILLSRFIRSSDPRPVKLLTNKGDLRVLVVIANPADVTAFQHPGGRPLAEVKVQEERQRACDSLGVLIKKMIASDPQVPGRATLNNMIAALRDGYDILYLVCHGILRRKDPQSLEEPYLLLEKEDGSAHIARGIELASAMRDLPHQPQLVVLASCQSAGHGNEPRGDDQEGALAALGPRLADAGVPAVLAMQGDVFMETVARFMPVFFEQLCQHGQIDQAMAAARSTAVLSNRPDWWMPVLFMRLREGRIWYVPGFAKEQGGMEKWPALLTSIRNGRCTPILGPMLTEFMFGLRQEIAWQLAETCHFPMAPHGREDLPQVSQYLAVKLDRPFLQTSILQSGCREIQHRFDNDLPDALRSVPLETMSDDELIVSLDKMMDSIWQQRQARNPAEPFKVLAGLGLPIYITTDPSNLLAKALTAAGKEPQVELCPWNEYTAGLPRIFDEEPNYRPDKNRPLVYHLFGRFQEPESLVLTEDDYFDYLIAVTKQDTRPLIPSVVRTALTDRARLFLGFQIDGWDFRVLFRHIISLAGGRPKKYAHVAAQIDPEEGRILEPEGARKYLESYYQKEEITIYWGSIEHFMQELNRRWKGVNP